MKDHHILGTLAVALLLLLCVTGMATAQAVPGTRVTACDPLTPNNALCLQWGAPATNTDGSPTVLALTYRIEQQFNAGAWTPTATGLTSTRYYAKGLAIGTYTFRVYVNCAGPNCVESAATASNSKDATAPVVQPGPALNPLVVQVTISADQAPVYRAVTPKQLGSTVYGFVPVGRDCKTFVARWRNRNWYLVDVRKEELWYTTDASNLAAPCS